MTAVAVHQYRPAMDSCMNGIRLYRIDALAAPDSSNNNNNNKHDNVYGAVIMAEPLREFTRFI